MEFVGAFLGVLILGGVIYWKIWWEGTNIGWRFTKWYFGLFTLAALVTASWLQFLV